MGATYTRQSSSTIVDGATIEAAHFNDEFDQLVAALAASTGHSHDGTAAEGGNVTKLLGTAITIGDGTAGTDIAVTFDGETSDGVLTWMEDEDHFKFSDDVVIDSSKRLYLNDEGGEYIYGDGTDLYLVSGADINIPADIGLTFGDDGEKIEGDGTDLTISASALFNVDAGTDIVLDAGGGDIFFKDDGTTFGSATNTSGNLIIKSGTTTALTFSGANATLAGDLTISGDDLTMGTNTDTAVLVADGTNFNPVVPSGDVTLTNAGVFAIASGVIVNADVNASAAIVDTKLDTISTANKVGLAALDIDGGTDIGEAIVDADLLIIDNGAGGTNRKTAASRLATYVGASAGAFSLANLDIDGGTDIGEAIVDADLFIVDNGAGGTNRKTAASRLKTYVGAADLTSIGSNLVPDGVGTRDIGTTSAEWNDLYLADTSIIYFGNSQDITLTHVADVGLTLTHVATADNKPIVLQLKSEEDIIVADEVIASLEFAAGDTDGTDGATVAAGIHAIAEGTFSDTANATKLVFTTGVSETAAASATPKLTLSSAGNLTVAGDLTVSGDDLTMGTNTSGAALIADGTNFNPVVISGDISINTSGVAAIGSGVIVAADIASSAVTTAKINADAVTGAKIADDAIDSEHYADGSIDNAHIADDAIDSEHYADGSIDTAHIADNQVTLAKMAGLVRGKFIYGDSSGDPAALTVGSANQILTADGTDLAWATGLTGNVSLPDAKSVDISTPLLAGADHTYTGLSAQMLAGGAISAFDLVCVHTTTQEVVEADASAYATARVIGIAPAAISDTATGTVLLHGFIRDDTWTWTTGSTLYLSETAGAMTHTAPTTDGAFVQVVGVALSPDVVYMNPSMDVIEHA